MADKIVVRRVDGKWAVLQNGTLVEGGFFAKGAAETVADTYRKELDKSTAQPVK